ncbi:MAG: IS3 family transposase, partial [Candidatus Binataceae bacterium]
VRFAFIETEKACFPVTLMCRMLAVSRAGFYAWRRRPAAARTREDQVLAVAVAAIYAEHHGRYGSPRVRMELRDRGQRSGRKRIARLMRLQGLRARPKRRYRTTTDSRHGLPVCPNLLARRFAVAQPNTAWVTDMTYLWTAQGWLYLAVIIDLFSLDALRMALAQRRPQPGLIHHSDRGSQYASGDYQQLLAQHGLRGSMSRRGDCWDNAVAESFFASLKLELVYQVQWRTRAEVRTAIFEYLELFYNRRRRHSSLGYLSPVEFERRNQRLLAA